MIWLYAIWAALVTATEVPVSVSMHDRSLPDLERSAGFDMLKNDVKKIGNTAAAESQDMVNMGTTLTQKESILPVQVLIPALATYTLFPTPTPNVLAGFLATVLWLSIFCCGFCALFGLQTPGKFVEKGLMMNKEY